MTRSTAAARAPALAMAGAALCMMFAPSQPAFAAGKPAGKSELGRISRTMPDWRGIWLIDPNPFDGTEAPDRKWFPPYKPEFAAKVEADRAAKAAAKVVNFGNGAACLPDGMPHILHTPYPNSYVIGPDQVVILNEFEHQVRIIYTDGRPHPKDPDRSYNGNSIGHWEGDTLVVDTIAIREDTSLVTGSGQPHSAALHTVERIRRISRDYIEDQVTMDDPVAFTHPWTITYKYKLHPDWTLQEYICQDNNRSLQTESGGAPSSAAPAK